MYFIWNKASSKKNYLNFYFISGFFWVIYVLYYICDVTNELNITLKTIFNTFVADFKCYLKYFKTSLKIYRVPI